MFGIFSLFFLGMKNLWCCEVDRAFTIDLGDMGISWKGESCRVFDRFWFKVNEKINKAIGSWQI